MSQMQRLLSDLSAETGVPADEIRASHLHRPHIVAARHGFIHAAWSRLGESKSQIARFLGIDWTSVHYAIRKMEKVK